MDEVYALSHTLCNARLKRNSQDEGGILTAANEIVTECKHLIILHQ